jgi:hypothetical protein
VLQVQSEQARESITNSLATPPQLVFFNDALLRQRPKRPALLKLSQIAKADAAAVADR